MGVAFEGGGTVCVCVWGGGRSHNSGMFFLVIAKNMGGFCDVADKEGWFSCKMLFVQHVGNVFFVTPFFTTGLSSALL